MGTFIGILIGIVLGILIGTIPDGESVQLKIENEAWRELGEELNKAREHRAIDRTRKVFEMLDALLIGGKDETG